MAQYLNLPNGYSVEIKEGETKEAALARAIANNPKVFGFGPAAPTEQPESGFIPALKSGTSELKAGIAALAGRTGIMDPAAAEQYIREQEEYQRRTFKPTATFGEAPVTKTLELLGGSVPYMAAPIVAGGLAATAPVSAPVATALGLGTAGAVSATQFTGSNIRRQMEGEGAVAPRALMETDIGAAALAAVPQAALDALSFKMLPGIRRILTSAGKDVPPAVAKQIAEQGVKEVAKDYALATGKAMGTEGLTEVGQQFLERMQAGLNLTDAKARDEYFESLIGGVVLGGVLSPAGRYVERRGEAARQEAARLETAKQVEAQEAQKREAERAFRQTPEGQAQFVQDYETRQARFKELQAVKKPGKDSTPLERAEYDEVKKERSKLGRELFADSTEYRKAVAGAAAFREQQRVAGLTPEGYFLEQLGVPPVQPALPPADDLFDLYTQPPAPPPPDPVDQYTTQQLALAKENTVLPPQANDYAEYLLQNPAFAAQIKPTTPMPGLSKRERETVFDLIQLNLQEQARKELVPRVEDLAGQIPKRAVGKRKAPDYQAYLEDLERIDYDRREGQTAADIAELESLRRQTAVTDQGEMFGIPAQKTVLGAAPKTRRELLADLRVARAAKDREAAEKIINDLRIVDKYETAQAERAAATREKFVLNGEQREALSAQGYSEEQIDEIESKAQKSIGQLLGVGETPLSVAIQQVMSESRADAFSEIVDLVNRFNRGAAKQEQLNAAKERVVAGLLADIQQSRGTPLTDDERRDITRRANELLRELVERWGDTRTLSQKGKDVFVPAQTRTGEFRTEKVPGAGFPTVEAQMAGRQTFGKPFAAAESIREGLEALRTEAVTATQAPSFTRAFTPEKIRAEAVETQLSRELAKDPKTHSPEQRRLLEAVADNLRMMLRPEVRQDTSAWLYELARDPKNVPTDRTQAIRDALQQVEQAKLSNQEQLGLPLGPGKKLQQVELQGPKKPKPITTGAFSQISFEPEYEEVTSSVFGSYAELKQYLASDALQEMRSSLGLGRPTIARLEQRLQPFIERVNAAKTKADELSEKAQAIEQQKRQQLETLKKMSEQDLEKEARALNVARETLGALQARVRELEAPLIKELQPLIKELDRAQKQFETAVTAQEKTIAAMENNTNVFANREIAAIERLHAVQRRMKAARSKIYKGFLEDFGADPANLARTMRDFKASGQQGAFNEQLQKAHNELNAVFFETRGEDQVIQSFLNQSFKLQLQLQEQANKIDALAESLLDAALNLDVVSRRQLEIAENRDEILDTRTQTEEAKAKVRELTAKQQERLEAVRALEAELGLDRQEIPHRIREDVTVAEVLRASTDTEKALVNQLDAAVADLNEAAQSVKALRVFDRIRTNARAKKPETDEQRQGRDAQRQRLLEAIGRDPNSFEGERISTEKRRQLLDELEATEETREGLEAIIAAANSAIPAVKAQIEKAGSEIKTLDKEIAQLEAKVKKRPRSFVAKLEQNSATITLNALLEARKKLAKSLTSYPPNTPIEARTVRSLADDLAAYEREKAAAESSLLKLDERKKELEALFSTDPEIRNARVEALDKRIAKVETNIKNQIEGLKEKGLRKTTRESREKELRKYKKELRDLMTQRSAKFGIERKALVPKPVAQPVEAGERLAPRKVGPLVRPTRTAGNVRTGVLETAGERKLSTRSKIGQTGKPKEAPQIEPIKVKGTAADRIMGELDALERVRQTAESRKNVARDAGDLISEAQYKAILGRIDAAIVEKQKELSAAQQAEQPAPIGPVNETVLRQQVNTLATEDVAKLEAAYGVKKRSKTFIAKLSADIVDMVNNGGKAVARGIRNIVKKMSEGVLAAAMIFNPQFSATNFSFDLPKAYSQTLTETVSIKAAVPTAAREKMSPLAQMVYENMAPTAKASGKGFGIVDKVNGAIHFFNNDGSLLVQGPALMGKDAGDVLGKSSLEGGPKITPAGRFTLEVSKDDFYGTSFNLLETFDSTGYVAIHPVYLGNLKENRLGRLQSPEATDNRVSYGCINTTKEMFVDKLAPNADSLNGGMLFIMPDVTERTAEMFPAKVETVTKTFSGTEQTARAEGRSLVGREEKLPEVKTLYQVATEINESPRVEVDPTQSAAALMATVAKDSKTPLNRAVAERLKGLLGETEVRIVKDLRNDAGGAAFGAAGVDGSYIALDADSGLNEQTVLHEGVHAAVERTLRKSEVSLTKNQLAAKRELEALYEAYAADAAAPNENAKESLSEFVADALSDPAVQLYMQTKKWTLKNMWNAFKNSILKIIGVDTPTTMLEATLAAADALMLTVPRPTQATTERLFQSKPVYANAEMARVGQDTDKFVAKQRSLWEKIKMNTTGLAFATQLVDRFAGFERLAKYMDSLKGSQMLYYLRMYDQRMNFVSDAVENGAPAIVEKTRPDGRKEYVIETKPGRPSISGVVKTLRAAQPMVGNAEAVNRMFTMYLAALRADRVGLEALNFGKDVTQEMLTNAKRVVEGNAALKDVFTKARNEYNAYNRNMMEFLASTGALSEEVANNLARTNDYIPFYREQDGNAMLIIGGESPMRIGSIAEQPYLKELVGGDTAILDFLNSSVQNTNMLVDMGLRNLATKNAIFELINLNAAKIVKGRPDGPDVVRFKLDGRDVYAVVDTETVKIGGQTFNTGVPADLLVKGMEGIPTQMPFVFRAMAMPAQLLRKAVTLSPIYMAKQLVRDSLSAAIVAGADFVPVAGSLRQLTSTNKQALRSRGVTGGQYFTGTSEDISKILRDVADGKPGWMSALGKLEAFGMEIDATTRRAQYNSYVEQGMSEMEATLLALESMNFNKRGASPSIHIANALIPFLNAQIQGLNVIYRAVTGQLPFSDKLKVQQKLLLKGGLLAGATLVYAAMMEDDEAYTNATPDQKYGNWFIRIPGFDEPVRVPVPFEIGYVFKALPEALYNTMTNKYGGEDAVKAFKQILLQTIPGGSSYGLPQALKPAIEAGLGKSFYTGRDILSAREKELLPEEQFRANTAEISKLFGKAFNISPVTFEYLVRGYTGTLGLAFLHAVSLGAPKSESPEAAVKRLSEYPLVGGVFQPNDAGGIINAVYERFNEDIKVRNSYMDMLKQGRTAEANNLLQRRSNEILEAEIGDVFKSNMTKLTQAERAIVASSMTAEEKRKRLDEIRKIKTGLAKSFREAGARATAVA